jgi:hypothetical protein
MSNASYFDNDLAIYKSFHTFREQSVQFRATASNWLNHPLPQFSSANQVTLKYNVDYNSKAISLNQCSASSPNCGGTSPTFGFLDQKTGGSYARIIELNIKYLF